MAETADDDVMVMRFEGNRQVIADLGTHQVRTDQPKESGGDDTAPSPYELFVASLGTCAGFFALRFCQTRNIPTDGLVVKLHRIRDEEESTIGFDIRLTLPPAFPEQYRDAILRAVDQCSVKRLIQRPPEFRIGLEPAQP